MTRWLLLFAAPLLLSAADSKRLVLIKADGLPGDVVERWARTSDPKTGTSVLPWINRIFFTRGTHVQNYYVRGISLSAPSWSMIDSGRHLVIHGNAEYDRATLHVYDYLNFFPFYLNSARARRADMPGVEVLDDAGIPLLIDRFDPGDRYQSMQLLQRGVKWRTLQHSLSNRVTTRSPKQLFDEWQTGFEFAEMISEQTEREITRRINRENFQYLDFFFGDYDHVTHLANDPTSALNVLKKLDGLVGRLWTAIENSGHAEDTILVLTSDHGMNSDLSVYSQGFNLIRFFNSAAGGGHHVITNRHPLTEYKMRGLDPFVNEVTSASSESLYLAGQAQQYPTALLDLDGNERASVHLRNNDLNRLHQLLQRLASLDAAAAERTSVEQELMALVDRKRPVWEQTLSELEDELAALARAVTRQQAVISAEPRKKFTQDERDEDLDEPPKRERALLDQWQRDDHGYREYALWLKRILSLEPGDLAPGKLKMESLVPRRTIGESNTIFDLQNYAASPTRRIDYFSLLTRQRVRNNVQAGVSSQPVDFVAVRVDVIGAASLAASLGAFNYAVFAYADEEHQALVLVKEQGRRVEIRYVPVAKLRQDSAGAITFEKRPWAANFPLHLFEDSNLGVQGDRGNWLAAWHTDAEWLEATHRTLYSNGVIGLAEHFRPLQLGEHGKLWSDAGADAAALRRFEERRFRMAQADLLLFASNHWNFNVRGFNPGGNHGSFFRVSTDATLMLSGAGIPAGLTIEQPYDTLSFVPTILRVAGLATDVQVQDYPGRVIQELVP